MSVRLRCAHCREELDLPDSVFREATHCSSCGFALWDEVAVRTYEAVAKQSPDDAESQCDLGLAYCRSGEPAKGAEAYETAIRLRPDLVEAHCGLGLALSRMHQYENAVGAYEAAIRLSPECFRAHHSIALVYSLLGWNDKAIEAAKRAISLDPNAAVTYWFLGGFYFEMDWLAEAIEALTKALTLQPLLPDASELLKSACEGKKHYEELVEACQAEIHIRPEEAGCYVPLGLAYVKLGHHMEAAEAFEMASSLGLRCFEPDMDQDCGPPLSEAARSLAVAIRMNPGNAPACLAFGIVCLLLGRQAETLSAYEALRSLAPDMAKTLRGIAGDAYWHTTPS